MPIGPCSWVSGALSGAGLAGRARVRWRSSDRQGARFHPQYQAAPPDASAQFDLNRSEQQRCRLRSRVMNARAPDRGAGPVAIICGAGTFPYVVADAALAQGRRAVLFALRGFADPAAVARYPHHWGHVGQLGRFRRLAQADGCEDVVFIGGLVRPSIMQLRFDLTTLRMLPRIILPTGAVTGISCQAWGKSSSNSASRWSVRMSLRRAFWCRRGRSVAACRQPAIPPI